ncbi:hypothetical protein [Poseidonibacter ostreae]|uniref:Uncharacterized protein n=1 Tax=Poseidonibacter ostreae TaxID=2654171 RepID=A0A6L4WSF4_9BACT|nr:hypothetical protein [Poseidonibacter ostreae]KAB7887149.1 hypothetical protein GA417_03740 [Poseidonibacter ostreae]KAB7888655.1 hypothetical protein GBG19_08580 [Poseidonibacter ostreae]KAB7892298.1 hypothetical protein GBG18_03340 [Poseidonibacter ostreae]MAC83646.1 hypothetical protein [Arcobacter sp.]
MKKILLTSSIIAAALFFNGCEEKQNKINRYLQNWTGVNGVLEVYAGEKLIKRFIKIDKLSTAISTDGKESRAYRYGYGFLDENLDFKKDANEKKVYFEVSDYSTYVFFENPNP